jgi:glycosyltransferase involved in cell wall biosynthesis
MSMHIDSTPLVSIVMPAYNEERFIAETIGYVQQQTYTNWELLVVDDRSNDSTQAVVASFAEKDERIKLIIRNREPKGAQACRNIGVMTASGQYILVLDSDDIIRPYAWVVSFSAPYRCAYVYAGRSLLFYGGRVFGFGVML